MACANSAAGVALKVFVEEHVILEVRVSGELEVIPQHGTLAVFAF
jgi:hypothetical protein